jgi:[ribosomal protein S5]-alanine N-acetyltransferase
MSIIETERLLLRPPTEDDAPAMSRGAGNLNVSRNLARVPHPYLVSDALDFIKHIAARHPLSLSCAIELNPQPKELIGMIGYEFHEHKNQAELGYWLAEPFWGNGIGKEASRAIVQHAFSVTKLHQLSAAYHDENLASARILIGLGFERTGHIMQFSKARGTEIAATRLKLTHERWLEFNA